MTKLIADKILIFFLNPCKIMSKQNHILYFSSKSIYMRIFFFAVALAGTIAGCNNNSVVKSASSKSDVLAVNMDTTVDPSQDFFMYANGGWIKNNPIPAAYGSWSIANLVIEENLKRLREISEKADSTKGAPGTAQQKIGDFWATAMDSTKIEQQGLQPLQP